MQAQPSSKLEVSGYLLVLGTGCETQVTSRKELSHTLFLRRKAEMEIIASLPEVDGGCFLF